MPPPSTQKSAEKSSTSPIKANFEKSLIPVEKEGQRKLLPLQELEELTGASFLFHFRFAHPSLHRDITKQCAKFEKKGELTREQVWLGTYFRQEILYPVLPDIFLRWIDPEMGWGVFANRNFRKMEFIAEYTGIIRHRKREDRKNSYCFEYLLSPGAKTPYTIDARDQGGISRYINHSNTPNLSSALATCDFLNHIVLFAKQPISKGTQLTYDYGPDYWSHRTPPKS